MTQEEDRLAEEAAILYDQTKYSKSIEKLDSLIKLTNDASTKAIAWYNKGLALNKLGLSIDAINAYEISIKFDPKYSSPWYNKGNILAASKRYKESIKCYNEAIEIKPEFHKAIGNKGNSLANLKLYRKAKKSFYKVLKIDPTDQIAQNNIGWIFLRYKKYWKAIRFFDEAIKIDPKYFTAWNNKGKTFVKLRKYSEAIDIFKKSIEINNNAFANYHLAEVYYIIGNLIEAKSSVENAIKENNKFVNAFYLKGKILIEQQEFEEAEKSFNEALKYSNDINVSLLVWSAYSHYLIAEFEITEYKREKYAKKISLCINKLEYANFTCKKIKEEEGIKVYVLYLLGYLYFKTGDIFTAKQRLVECIKGNRSRILYFNKLTIKGTNDKNKVKHEAREFLGYIWENKINPPFWRWWLYSPIRKWQKRGLFSILTLCISIGAFTNNIKNDSLHYLYFQNTTIQIIFISVSILFLLLPLIQKIKVKDYEVELKSPPPFNLSTSKLESVAREGSGLSIEDSLQ